jgi:Mg2+/Co2+ transporter CorC
VLQISEALNKTAEELYVSLSVKALRVAKIDPALDESQPYMIADAIRGRFPIINIKKDCIILIHVLLKKDHEKYFQNEYHDLLISETLACQEEKFVTVKGT